MRILISDITLGGSTKQFLEYGVRNYTREVFVQSIQFALIFCAKTKPTKIARRLGSLIGLTYDELKGNPYILNCIIEAFHNVEKELNHE